MLTQKNNLMSLIKKSNFSNFPSMMEDFFKDDFFRFPSMSNMQQSVTVPSVNIKETEDRFELEVAAPGYSKEEFKLHLDQDLLTISAEQKEDKEVKEDKFRRREFYYSSFKRSFTLPESVAGENIQASYENGILHITLPKKEEAKVKPAKVIEIS